MSDLGQKKPFDVGRAAAQEWVLTWRTATPEDLGELEEIADVGGVRAVENGKEPPVSGHSAPRAHELFVHVSRKQALSGRLQEWKVQILVLPQREPHIHQSYW